MKLLALLLASLTLPTVASAIGPIGFAVKAAAQNPIWVGTEQKVQFLNQYSDFPIVVDTSVQNQAEHAISAILATRQDGTFTDIEKMILAGHYFGVVANINADVVDAHQCFGSFIGKSVTGVHNDPCAIKFVYDSVKNSPVAKIQDWDSIVVSRAALSVKLYNSAAQLPAYKSIDPKVFEAYSANLFRAGGDGGGVGLLMQ